MQLQIDWTGGSAGCTARYEAKESSSSEGSRKDGATMMMVVAKKNNSCNCISNSRHRDPLPQLLRNYLMCCRIAKKGKIN